MNNYGVDLSFLEYGIPNEYLNMYEAMGRRFPDSPTSLSSTNKSNSNKMRNKSPPKHRHDGTSPLPLGMDWSTPPRTWDGHNTVWPHDPRSGWSYCVTIPSWTILSNSGGSGSVVFYRVQVAIQTPEAITTTREILHRFSDFLDLFSELKKVFPKKSMPVPPPRRLLGTKSKSLIEERRTSLEDWMEKLLSDIDISRSAPVAIFIELEAAVRSSFNTPSGNGVSSSVEYQPSLDFSETVDGSSIVSDNAEDTGYERSDVGSLRRAGSLLSTEGSSSDIDPTRGAETSNAYIYKVNRGMDKEKSFEGTIRGSSNEEDGKNILSEGENAKGGTLARRLSIDSAQSEVSPLKTSEVFNWGTLEAHGEGGAEGPINEDLQFPSNLVVALPLEQRHKFSRVLVTMQQRLATAKADMEDLVARLNQELAVRQYLTMKVTDLEVDQETTKENAKDSLQQAISTEKERYTQMQWDVEEFRKKCLELEMKFKDEQDEKARIIAEHLGIIQENEMLMQELHGAREQIENLQKQHEEVELKSKTDVKVLVKEVKSLRSSQSELKQELSNIMKEKLELEKELEHEKHRKEQANSVNEKLLHECSILQKRLQESSVNFLVEKEDKLVMDISSPSDAIDLLSTSDNRIGLLVAEAQLLAQDVENSVTNETRTTLDELRKMITEIFVDNATLRKQVNSVIRCALKTHEDSEANDEEDEAPARKTVLSNYL